MILWTPSKNNQRYAFTPLLDAEDDEEDEEDEAYYTDAFDVMKQRMTTLTERPIKWKRYEGKGKNIEMKIK